MGTTCGAKVTTPGVREKPESVEDEDVPLEGPEAITRYRSLCMRMAYVAQDRADLGVLCRELAKGMSAPTERHMQQLKRGVRYLRFNPRLVQLFDQQDRASAMQGWSDADHAGCIRTRKSTSGGCIMIGLHCVTHWCRGQAVIALSSGEAEFYALVTLVAEMCGANSLAKDWNLEYKFGVNMDATAAIGMAGRRGLGKVKHVHTVFLWIQERLQEYKAVVKKQHTSDMLADILTKFLPRETLEKLLKRMGYVYRDSRHSLRLEA